MRILAMRLAGMPDKDIADYLKISPKSIGPYIYKAGKNGWIQEFTNPRETIEAGLMHKVLRNLDSALDDDARNEKTMMPVKTAVALKIAEGTVFKDFEPAAAAPPAQMTAVSIRIERTDPIPIREGTIGGTPHFIEGAYDPVEQTIPE